MQSDDSAPETFSDPLYVLLGSLATAVVGGIAWLCKNKCRDQSCDLNSGCCKFHSSSRIRETIREEVRNELRASSEHNGTESDIESGQKLPDSTD